MSEKKKRSKKGLYARIPLVKANRIKALGVEKGIRASKKTNLETVKKELATSDKEWQQRLDRQKQVADREITDLKSSEQLLTQTIKEMRDSQAEQLKLVRRIYQDKNQEVDKLIVSLNEKITDIDRYKFLINDFLSKNMAELERIKARQEAQVVSNAEDMRSLKFIQTMQQQYEKITTSPRAALFESQHPTRRELN